MNLELIVSFVIVVFAISSFFFLAHTLWSIWSSRGWMDETSESEKESGRSEGLQRGAWKESACYKYCMLQTYSGVGSTYTHCASRCGLE